MNLVDSTPRRLGASDLTSGPLAFGCWRFTNGDVAGARALLEAAVESGMHLIDTADVYGLDWGGGGFGASEEIFGKVLNEAPALRDEVILATKGGIVPPIPYDSSDEYLRQACDASLRRLQTDVIDLYQVHRPDLFTHPEALAETLMSLHGAGKVRSVGVSNFTVDQYDALARHMDFEPIVTMQPQYSVAHLAPLRDGTFDRAMRDGVTPLAWSPLAGGAVVSGEGLQPELVETLDRLAEREGCDRAAVALAFVLAHPSRPVAIVGSQQVDHLFAARKALQVQLDRNDCYDIIEASEGIPLP